MSHGGLVQKMVFIVRGKLESIGKDGIRVLLSEGDASGEELLIWYLEQSSKSKETFIDGTSTSTGGTTFMLYTEGKRLPLLKCVLKYDINARQMVASYVSL